MAVTIERLGHLGDAIAPGPVYVRRALPGEVVEGEVQGDRITEPRIVTPSPDRVAAPCRHYRGCGGCALQHASDKFVAGWKVAVVRSALEARGLPSPLRRLHTSALHSRRRATFCGRRTKKGATVGFHAPASDVIHEVPGCLLILPEMSDVLAQLERIVIAGGSRKGEMRLVVTATATGLDVAASGGKPLDMDLRQALIAIASESFLARLTWEDEPVIVERRPVMRLGDAPVPLPPGAFLQATTGGEAALLASVKDALGDGSGPVVDLFSGIGTFTLPIARHRDVHAVESEAVMLEALDEGWRQGLGLHRVTTERRDLFRRPLVADELGRFAAAIIDPPRAGAEAQTVELARSGLKRIAFVSCNPVTFARDAGLLIRAGYAVEWIDLVDQFRWSTHVELTASFVLS